MLEAAVVWRGSDFTLDAELHLRPGVTALFGPSGSGKSTLLSCLAGLIRPERGRIVRNGEVLFDSGAGIDRPPERRRLGLVFQDGRLFPHLTVRDNLAFGYRLVARADRRFSPERIHELLELGPLLERSVRRLSGGEIRRVALGRALLAAPTLLLLDEPLAGLDERRKGSILHFLRDVRDELDLPILYVSHSVAEFLELTTRVAVIERGRILGQGEYDEMLGADGVSRLAASPGLPEETARSWGRSSGR